MNATFPRNRISLLLDVDPSDIADGVTLRYDATAEMWKAVLDTGGGGATTLAGLTDVDLTGATDGQALALDDASGKWIPQTISGGGGGGGYLPDYANIFEPGSMPADLQNFSEGGTASGSYVWTPQDGSKWNRLVIFATLISGGAGQTATLIVETTDLGWYLDLQDVQGGAARRTTVSALIAPGDTVTVTLQVFGAGSLATVDDAIEIPAL